LGSDNLDHNSDAPKDIILNDDDYDDDADVSSPKSITTTTTTRDGVELTNMDSGGMNKKEVPSVPSSPVSTTISSSTTPFVQPMTLNDDESTSAS
jgi:hypothetical protein